MEWISDGRQVEDYSVEMHLLRRNLQEVLKLDASESEINYQQVFELLVPAKYRKQELEDLIVKASALKNWFIRADSSVMIINRKYLHI